MLSSWNHALATFDQPPITRNEAIRRASIPSQELFLTAFGENAQQAKSAFYSHMGALEEHKRLNVLPGSTELLTGCSELGIPLAVVSNKSGSIVRQEVDLVGWTKLFAAVVGGGDAAFDKPRPDPVLYALAQMDIACSKDAWMVGDMHSDIEAACRAGVTAVLIETTASLNLGLEGNFDTHKPDLRVSDAQALLALLEGEAGTISV